MTIQPERAGELQRRMERWSEPIEEFQPYDWLDGANVRTAKDLDSIVLASIANVDPMKVRHRHVVARLARERAAELVELANVLENRKSHSHVQR